MKIYKINFKNIALVAVMALSASCSDSYLDRPTEDNYVSDNFYSSDEQVQRTTYGMYGRMWAPFYNKCFYALSEMSSGNIIAYTDGNELMQFKLTSDSFILEDSWKSCFAVIAQSNDLINHLNSNVKEGVSQSVIKNTIAEAHFFRAVSYFYLVRLFGAVPIIEDNVELVQNPLVNTNRVQDVYKFIENDLKYASENLQSKTRLRTPNAVNIYLTQGSANSFLAKVYLYEKKYPESKAMAEKVINSGEFGLMDKFSDLFLTRNNNNHESIYSWQWSGALNQYLASNYSNVQYGLDILNDNVSYGGMYMPSNDIQTQFENGDLRRKESYMVYGDAYPNMKADGVIGFVVDKTKYPSILDGTGASVKKYVVGQATDETGPADANGGMSNSNYIMRYADLLLIHAEASLGDAAETQDAAAKESFNKVRRRAGVPELDPTTPLTHDKIFHERRVEFAFEGEFWYDLGRLPRAEAISIISKQDRGFDWQGGVHYTPTATDFIFPKPANDVRKNPKLKDAPVPYVFK
jgi:hypothetical protein